MARLSPRVLDILGTFARLGLAVVWFVSGGLKAADANQTYLAVRAYDVLPTGLVSVVASGLPWLELALGLLILLGVGTRLVAVLSAALLLLFMVGVSQAWVRGLAIDCGCFGGGGQVGADRTRYGQELARDTGFVVLAVWLIIRPRTLLSTDRLLGKDLTELDHEETEVDGEPEVGPTEPAEDREGSGRGRRGAQRT